MMKMKKVYILGNRSEKDKEPQVPVLVTIETIDNLTVIVNENLKTVQCPFYQSLNINCGKIHKITDVTEKIEFLWTNIKGTDGDSFKIQKGQFFLGSLTCYVYKIAAMEAADPHYKFRGVRYTHYSNGLIKSKQCYNSGKITHSYRYRNDTYNTIYETTIYRNGKPEIVNTYDEQEILSGQTFLMSNGKVFTSAHFQVQK